MKVYLTAVAVAIVVAVGAVYVLDGLQRPVDQAFASAQSTRIPDHGTTTNLVGRDWRSSERR